MLEEDFDRSMRREVSAGSASPLFERSWSPAGRLHQPGIERRSTQPVHRGDCVADGQCVGRPAHRLADGIDHVVVRRPGDEALLAALPVKGRAPKTGYDRDLFGQAWSDDWT